MQHWLWRRLSALAKSTAMVCCALLLGLAMALAQQAVPELSAHVIDNTGTLNTQQVQQLENRLTTFEQSRGSQIVLLLVGTTAPEDIASYANRVANAWKIGRRGVGDGILIIVAKSERKVRIEVAKTLEGAIPDLMAKRIIDETITPRFKQGDFAGGLEAATGQIMLLIGGEALPAPEPIPTSGNAGFDLVDLALFVFFAVPVFGGLIRGVLGTKLGALVTGTGVGALALFFTASLLIASMAGVVALLITLFSNFSRSSGGWGSNFSGISFGGDGNSGGGFSSGGGGDFGGGGASGDW